MIWLGWGLSMDDGANWTTSWFNQFVRCMGLSLTIIGFSSVGSRKYIMRFILFLQYCYQITYSLNQEWKLAYNQEWKLAYNQEWKLAYRSGVEAGLPIRSGSWLTDLLVYLWLCRVTLQHRLNISTWIFHTLQTFTRSLGPGQEPSASSHCFFESRILSKWREYLWSPISFASTATSSVGLCLSLGGHNLGTPMACEWCWPNQSTPSSSTFWSRSGHTFFWYLPILLLSGGFERK